MNRYYQVPQLSLIRVAGSDAVKVLNGLCTAKLVDLTPGKATEAMFTDDRGRVLAHAMVALDTAGVWIISQIPEPAKLVAHIDRFIFREDATPRDETATWSCWLVDAEPATILALTKAAADTSSMTPAQDAPASDAPASDALPDLVKIALVNQHGWWCRMPITSPTARLSLVPLDQASRWEETLIAAGCTRGEAAEFETRRVQNFWPVAGREISERTLPQELDRDVQAISFNKGCYLGQETVARLDAMGEVQRKLCLVQLSGIEEIVTPQALVRDGKEVGSLTSAAPLVADGRRLGLALMRRGSMSPGSSFMAGAVPGEVCDKGSEHLASNG